MEETAICPFLSNSMTVHLIHFKLGRFLSGDKGELTTIFEVVRMRSFLIFAKSFSCDRYLY